MRRNGVRVLGVAAGALLAGAVPLWAGLEDDLGRNETRVWSAPYALFPAATVVEMALPERLERLGYRRVHDRPEQTGEYFWGYERFWIYRRAHDLRARRVPARLIGLELEPKGGRVVDLLDRAAEPLSASTDGLWLEPELLSETLTARRARRRPVRFEELPEHIWRPVLAAEHARFFEHSGLDARGIARALLKNVLAGEVVQGGSTITQQLVKLRDLSPRRTLGRKVSEAARALALEAEYDKLAGTAPAS